jgi:hypothetical protein
MIRNGKERGGGGEGEEEEEQQEQGKRGREDKGAREGGRS